MEWPKQTGSMPQPASDSSPCSYITGRDSLKPDGEPGEESAVPESPEIPNPPPCGDPRAIISLAGAVCVPVALEGFEREEAQVNLTTAEVRWYYAWDIPTRPQEEVAGVRWGHWRGAAPALA